MKRLSKTTILGFFSLFGILFCPAVSAQSVPAVLDDLAIVGSVDSGWEVWLSQSENCETPRICELFRRAATDSFLRRLYVEHSIEGHSDTKTFFQHQPTQDEIGRWITQSDQSNQAWLAQSVEQDGWFDIQSHGELADQAAFLIVQHADLNRSFQKRMLNLLEGLTKSNGTARSNWAMLYDRIAVAENRNQRFGSQGDCVETGQWRPFPIEDESELERLRAAHDLPHMSAYEEQLNASCF